MDPHRLGVPMFFGGIDQEATPRAVADADLRVELSEVVEGDEGDGHVVRFLWLLARKEGRAPSGNCGRRPRCWPTRGR
jgi:hypothetical protein